MIKFAIEYIDEIISGESSDLDIIDMFREYAGQFIDMAANIADSKYPAQNKESILKLKQLIK